MLRLRPLATSLVILALLAILLLLRGCTLIGIDPDSGKALPLLPPDTQSLADRLRGHVEHLAGEIGERSLADPARLRRAEHYLAATLAKAEHRVRWQTYTAVRDGTPHEVSNLEVEIPGTTRPAEILLVGAHYDTVNHRGVTTPGANDNASGTAAVLELARLLRDHRPARTIRLVLFVNEEPPYFWTDSMGSLVYARAAKQRRDEIVGMISIETIGYYRDEPGSQDYPPLVGTAYPDTGDFVAFVGPASNGGSDWIQRCTAAFRAASPVPAEGAALPSLVPRINSSDHWSFWKQGWPALMVTDTAPYRYPYYHKPEDTPDKLDYARMALVVEGLDATIRDLSDDKESRPTDPAEPRSI